jgi:hypothetical protein
MTLVQIKDRGYGILGLILDCGCFSCEKIFAPSKVMPATGIRFDWARRRRDEGTTLAVLAPAVLGAGVCDCALLGVGLYCVCTELPKGGNMPYMCDNSRLNWTDDDEPIPPMASDFVYLPAKELGGPSGPAELRIPNPSEPNSSEDFENPQEARALHLSLKASGVAKVYCQYDGGNDEGFAWVDHAELKSGEKLNMAALAKRLIANGVSARKRMPWQKDWSEERVIQEMLDFPLAVNWAAALLGGRSFGTGNYSMYGAFVVDLVAETITDDPKANPIVRHIEIDGVSRAPDGFDPTSDECL